jgi:hypothetical protein
MKDREHNLVIRVDRDELAMAHALADDRDEPIARMLRRFIRDSYQARFGSGKPPEPRLKRTR